jgi:hypothetical protein
VKQDYDIALEMPLFSGCHRSHVVLCKCSSFLKLIPVRLTHPFFNESNTSGLNLSAESCEDSSPSSDTRETSTHDEHALTPFSEEGNVSPLHFTLIEQDAEDNAEVESDFAGEQSITTTMEMDMPMPTSQTLDGEVWFSTTSSFGDGSSSSTPPSASPLSVMAAAATEALVHEGTIRSRLSRWHVLQAFWPVAGTDILSCEMSE